MWKEIFAVFERILATLVANPELKIEQTGGTTVVDTVQQTTAEQGDEDDEFLDGGVTQMTARARPRPARPPVGARPQPPSPPVPSAEPPPPPPLSGLALSYLERLDDEFYKSLQLQDHYGPDYVSRLKDEVPLVNLMQDTLEYYDTKKDSPGDAARVAARVVEHIYYREQGGSRAAPSRPPRRAPPPPPRPRPSHAPPSPPPSRSTTSTRRSRTR